MYLLSDLHANERCLHGQITLGNNPGCGTPGFNVSTVHSSVDSFSLTLHHGRQRKATTLSLDSARQTSPPLNTLLSIRVKITLEQVSLAPASHVKFGEPMRNKTTMIIYASSS